MTPDPAGALRRKLPRSWAGTVRSEGRRAAFAAADPSNRKTDAVEIRKRKDGWYAQAMGYNEARGMGDLVEAAGPFDTAATAARSAADLVEKHFAGDRRPGAHRRKRNYSSMRTNAMDDPEFDFGGWL